MKKFVALAALAACCSLAIAADWQPLPGAPKAQFYDASGVVWEGKGRVQVVQREVLTEARAQNTFVGHPLHEGSVVETTHLLNCKERRAYQRFVQFYDERGAKVHHPRPATAAVETLDEWLLQWDLRVTRMCTVPRLTHRCPGSSRFAVAKPEFFRCARQWSAR